MQRTAPTVRMVLLSWAAVSCAEQPRIDFMAALAPMLESLLTEQSLIASYHAALGALARCATVDDASVLLFRSGWVEGTLRFQGSSITARWISPDPSLHDVLLLVPGPFAPPLSWCALHVGFRMQAPQPLWASAEVLFELQPGEHATSANAPRCYGARTDRARSCFIG